MLTVEDDPPLLPCLPPPFLEPPEEALSVATADAAGVVEEAPVPLVFVEAAVALLPALLLLALLFPAFP